MKTTTTTTPTTRRPQVTIPVTGSMTIAQLAQELGAKADGHAYTFNAKFEVSGTETATAASSNVSKADMEKAMLTLSQDERAVIEKFNALAKDYALARVTGQTGSRQSWKGFVKARA